MNFYFIWATPILLNISRESFFILFTYAQKPIPNAQIDNEVFRSGAPLYIVSVTVVARVGNSVKPSCIPFWESASGPQLLPTLGHHNFSFNSISAESCLAGPVNVSKWCLKYVPRATLSSLRSLVSTLFQKKRKGSVFAIGLGIFYQHLVFFPVYLLYPKMVLNWVAQYYANLQFWGLFTTE